MRKRTTLMFFALFAVLAAFAENIFNLSAMPDDTDLYLNDGDILTGVLNGSKVRRWFP